MGGPFLKERANQDPGHPPRPALGTLRRDFGRENPEGAKGRKEGGTKGSCLLPVREFSLTRTIYKDTQLGIAFPMSNAITCFLCCNLVPFHYMYKWTSSVFRWLTKRAACIYSLPHVASRSVTSLTLQRLVEVFGLLTRVGRGRIHGGLAIRKGAAYLTSAETKLLPG